MTQTMLERAARAAGEVPATMADDVRDVLSEAAIERVVRAVLVAVREPDDDVSEIGDAAQEGFVSGPGDARTAFTAMIDAILNEPQP